MKRTLEDFEKSELSNAAKMLGIKTKGLSREKLISEINLKIVLINKSLILDKDAREKIAKAAKDRFKGYHPITGKIVK